MIIYLFLCVLSNSEITLESDCGDSLNGRGVWKLLENVECFAVK